MPDLSTISDGLGMILQICNLIMLAWALKKFLSKPQETLAEQIALLRVEIDTLKLELKDVKDSLRQGNDRFREQDKTSEVILRAVTALIRFEIHYCETEHKQISPELTKADEELNEYLYKR